MQRTSQQNRALYKYCDLLATALEEAGYDDMRTAIHVPIRPSKIMVKETIIKPVLQAMFPGKTSTTELTTTEVMELYDTINRAVSERFGIYVPWPSEESQYGDSLTQKG